MKKIVKIKWGVNTPWNDDKIEARRVRTEYLESKVLAGLTSTVVGTHGIDYSVVQREWIDQAAAEEEVTYITPFAQTYGLDIISVEIYDAD